MPFYFSLLKNVNFLTPDNLLFLAIISVLVIIFISVIIYILSAIGKAIKKLFGVKKEKEEIAKSAETGQIKEVQQMQSLNNVAQYKAVEESFINQNSAKEDVPEKDDKEKYEEKEQKNIAEGLSRLKTVSLDGKETISSKMPSLSGEDKSEAADIDKKIVIPVVKKFQTQPVKANVTPSSLKTENIASVKNTFNKSQTINKPETANNPAEIINEKILKENNKGNESSLMFGNKDEISRLELDRKLRRDPEIWKAQKDLRMNLTPMERVKLEKETFSSVYGKNISKKDLKVNIKKMGREWATTSDMKRKEVLRKELKFFKKIGGIQ